MPPALAAFTEKVYFVSLVSPVTLYVVSVIPDLTSSHSFGSVGADAPKYWYTV
ncbi:hypothetical protein D3C81_1791550 [compost metagenome]